MISATALETSNKKILKLIKDKKYEEADEAIRRLQADLESNTAELEAALRTSRKASKDVGLMQQFVTKKKTKLEVNGSSEGSVRDRLRELDPSVKLGITHHIGARISKGFGNHRRPATN